MNFAFVFPLDSENYIEDQNVYTSANLPWFSWLPEYIQNHMPIVLNSDSTMILRSVLTVAHNQHEIFNGLLKKRSRPDSFNLNHNNFDMEMNK
jgi:hypothetical protein